MSSYKIIQIINLKNIIIMIFKCEATKCPSGLWILTKVLNNEKEFAKYEVFDGDYLHDNLPDNELTEIKEDWNCIEFDIRIVSEDDIDIHNIKEKYVSDNIIQKAFEAGRTYQLPPESINFKYQFETYEDYAGCQ